MIKRDKQLFKTEADLAKLLDSTCIIALFQRKAAYCITASKNRVSSKKISQI